MVFLQGLILGRAMMTAMHNRGEQVAMRNISRASTSRLHDRSTEHSNRRRRSTRPLMIDEDSSPDGRNPHVKRQLLDRLGGTSVRNLSSKTPRRDSNEPLTQTELKELLKDEEWNAVFRYPYIRHCILICRVKMAQTLLTCGALVPITVANWYYGQLSLEVASGVCIMGFVALAMMLVFTRFSSRLIGVISVNKKCEYARIGYLSFWGFRRNRFIPVDDIVPLSEIHSRTAPHKIFVNFQQYSESEHLYLPIQNVEIVDARLARRLFGNDLSILNELNKEKTD